MKSNKKLKNLNLEPLSIAKYFYERGVKNLSLIQKLIYLTFVEVIEKENTLLFNEEWQAWSGGPVLESVFRIMDEHLEKHGNYQRLFEQTPPLKDKKVIPYCQAWAERYQNYAQNKDHYKLAAETQTLPWQLARRNLSNEWEGEKIELADIIHFARQRSDEIRA